MRERKVILIGGTSNVGKSTVAQALAARLGWRCVSTDTVGRHPGRPWPIDGRPVPAHVVRHYLALPVEDLTAQQVAHYDRMWPAIVSLIERHTSDDGAGGLILEGSGVWPDRASRFAELTGTDRILVDKFIGRTQRYDELMVSAARRAGMLVVAADSFSSLATLVDKCWQLLTG